jgi:phosphoribosylaminoimidazolecarboxamide formyltransferase / IMP cyclohydrolase
MPRALLSVSDKRGLVDFGRGLAELGWELVSTGGTARALREAGLEVLDVSAVTGHPEIMAGRVKTLHPAVHAGILARRDVAGDRNALEEHGYQPIDLVAVNLYPFHEAVAAGAAIPAAMEEVDIGGPSMIRGAAKNHAHVIVIVDPDDYGGVLDALREGGVDGGARAALAQKVYAHTSAYDAAIADYLVAAARAGGGAGGGARADRGAVAGLPLKLELQLGQAQHLRYGENPDQPAALYVEEGRGVLGAPLRFRQLQGKELSFNNILDLDAALMAVAAWADEERVACAIIKHTTPCGVALSTNAEAAWRRALEADPVSAFGGIVGFTKPVDAAAAEALAPTFLEVVVAPGFDEGALAVLGRKKNLRLIELPIDVPADDELDVKRVRGGVLVQRRLSLRFPEQDWRVVTRRRPAEAELRDLRFAWRVSAVVKSNAIVLARDEQTRGIGAGQMSRVDSSRLAVLKAADAELDIQGAALASDAFFPFRDGVDAAAAAGVGAIIQPGGSVRDEEVIAAADEHGLAMVFTGRRLFRH